MKFLLISMLLFINLSSWATGNEELCFDAYQDGVPVDVICDGRTVSFKNCTASTPADATVLFYLGPKSGITGGSETIAEGEAVTFPGVNTYTVTLILNRAGEPEYLERQFKVKATPQPTFAAKVCANNLMEVTITDQRYDYYILNFTDGSSEVSALKGEIKRHAYTGDGPFKVAVTGYYRNAVCSSATISETIPALPTYVPPTITGLQVREQGQAGTMVITSDQLAEQYSYTLTQKLQGESNFSAVASLNAGQTTHIIGNINTNIAAEYRIEATDICGTDLGPSNSVYNIVLNATAENEYNTVQWETLKNFPQLQLYKNGALVNTDPITSPYLDREVICEQEYVYMLKGIMEDGTVVSTSAEQRVTSYSTVPPPAGNLFATYNLQNQVELTFTPPDGHTVQEIYLQRSIEKASFTQLPTLYESSTYTDKIDAPVPLCYMASFKNGCAISASSQTVCPVLLAGQSNKEGYIDLFWTAYEGFPSGNPSYIVEVLDENNNIIYSYPAANTSFQDQNAESYEVQVRYRIKAVAQDGTATYSNIISIEQEIQLHIPSAFTPNGDGLNDLFEIKGRSIKEFSIKIYNGMGNVVYSATTREEGWDGTYNGSPLPAGAYAYEVIVSTSNKRTKRRTGTITLLR